MALLLSLWAVSTAIYFAIGFDRALWSNKDSYRSLFGGRNTLNESVTVILNTNQRENVQINLLTNGKPFHHHLEPHAPIKILIHGFMDSHEGAFIKSVKEAYIKTSKPVNVIVLGWGEWSQKDYFTARKRVLFVAKQVGELIDRLVSQYGVELEDVHIIGHSLGAHIGGIAALRVKYGKVGRVTGLDPANVMFTTEVNYRIGKHVANFVDVIHTSAYIFGLPEDAGHADFYVNGGYVVQPGCKLRSLGMCAHSRAYEYFAESINNPKGFVAIECDSFFSFVFRLCSGNNKTTMGEATPSTARGAYYLVTDSKPPYALGKKGATSRATIVKKAKKIMKRLQNMMKFKFPLNIPGFRGLSWGFPRLNIGIPSFVNRIPGVNLIKSILPFNVG